MQPATSGYYLKSQTLTRINSSLFTLGFQIPLPLTKKSELTLGGSFNFGTSLHGNRTFVANKISNTSGAIINVNNESWDNGEVFFPFRMIVGASYQYNKRVFAGDYIIPKNVSLQKNSDESRIPRLPKAAWRSLQSQRDGRYWWQRNKYTAGAYFTRSQLRFNYTDINTYGSTVGLKCLFAWLAKS